MSLTSHLKSKESQVRQFVYECAPQLALAGARGRRGQATASSFGFDELTALATQLPIPEEVKVKDRKSHSIVAGMALDYRLRMDSSRADMSSQAAGQLVVLPNRPEWSSGRHHP